MLPKLQEKNYKKTMGSYPGKTPGTVWRDMIGSYPSQLQEKWIATLSVGSYTPNIMGG